MHQDIQSFSDLTDIDTSERLEVAVRLIRHGNVEYRFSINGDEFTSTEFRKKCPLTGPLILRCEIKNFIEGSGAVEIDSVTVNGNQILPIYLHHGIPQTSYFNTSRPWEFRIDIPFYVWYHNITGQGWIA